MLNGSYDLHILFYREPQIGATLYSEVSKKGKSINMQWVCLLRLMLKVIIV